MRCSARGLTRPQACILAEAAQMRRMWTEKFTLRRKKKIAEGRFVQVEVTEALDYDLFGRALEGVQ